MSLDINNTGAYEREVEQNWAAAYAKRLVDQEESARDRAIAAAVAEEAAARDAVDTTIKNGTALANGAVTNSKLASDVFASVQETRWGQDTHKAVTPDGLKQGIGHILPATVINGEFMIDNLICDSIDADVTSIFGNPVRDAGLREYSETPVQVGTWADGTPVWRVAIDRTITAEDIADASYNPLDDITNEREDVNFVLEGRAVLTCESPSCIDYVDCILESDGDLEWDATQQSGSGYTRLVGFITFATPATNIITS